VKTIGKIEGGKNMKPTNILRIYTALILAMFILSLFSGTVAAQVHPPEKAVREQIEKTREQIKINKEKYDNTREQYQEKKEKYDDTRKQFEDAKDLFEKANRRLMDAKFNKSDNKSNEELMDKAREYILKAIDHTEAQLQVMKNRLDNGENRGITASDATKIIDAHTAQLEDLKVKVNNATTIQEIRDTHKELAGIVAKINLETRYFIGTVLNQRIDNFINRSDNVSIKVDDAIENLEAQGNDTTNLKAAATDFKNKLEEAKDIQAKTIALFATHSGFAADGTVTNEKDARDFLKQANELQRENIKKLKEAGRQLIDFGRDFRKLVGGHVKVNDKGDLEVNGGATTTLTGGATPALTEED
jgi:tetratricopeptide (TPR) repeat protein